MPMKLTRKRREHLQRRREVLESALHLFSRKGFEETTMAEIAERAEFAVGTLYKLFKDKRALYRALILDTMQEYEETLMAALNVPGTESEKLNRYIEAKTSMFVRRIPTARLYFGQTTGSLFLPAVGLDTEGRAMHQRLMKQVEAVLRRGIRKKVFVNIDPAMLVLGLEGVGNAFLVELIDRPDDFTAEEMASLIKRIFFDSVRTSAVNE